MKIGVIADVHGNLEALKAVISDMKEKEINSTIVLGDIVFKGPKPLKCFEMIEALDTICWIKGNTDDWFNQIDDAFQPKNQMEERIYKEFLYVKDKLPPEAVKKISELPESKELCIGEKTILCVHGSDRKIHEPIGIMTSEQEVHALLNRLEQDILLCGHTHLPYVISCEGKLIMNVGSVGLPDDEPKASYGIIDISGEDFEYSIRKLSI